MPIVQEGGDCHAQISARHHSTTSANQSQEVLVILQSLFLCLIAFLIYRFEYDFNAGRKKKRNDLVDLPFELSLKVWSSESKEEQEDYELSAVLVHSGQADAGHYYSYVRYQDHWIECNDTVVRPFSLAQKQQEWLGGKIKQPDGQMVDNTRSAYMLLYQRRGGERASSLDGKLLEDIQQSNRHLFQHCTQLDSPHLQITRLIGWLINTLSSSATPPALRVQAYEALVCACANLHRSGDTMLRQCGSTAFMVLHSLVSRQRDLCRDVTDRLADKESSIHRLLMHMLLHGGHPPNVRALFCSHLVTLVQSSPPLAELVLEHITSSQLLQAHQSFCDGILSAGRSLMVTGRQAIKSVAPVAQSAAKLCQLRPVALQALEKRALSSTVALIRAMLDPLPSEHTSLGLAMRPLAELCVNLCLACSIEVGAQLSIADDQCTLDELYVVLFASRLIPFFLPVK